MARPVDENDLTNAMDLLRQEMNAVQDKALKLVINLINHVLMKKLLSMKIQECRFIDTV